jgi:ubiquinone/menaquinone biosynthesis C-methylase UbiE
MQLERYKQGWEEIGKLDPLWAVLTEPSGQYGRWDRDAFFRTGADEISRVMEEADKLAHPRQKGVALDFGCGVGRLTRALAQSFEKNYGVDISHAMIIKARELNQDLSNCTFIVNNSADLSIFPSETVDFIYTARVLQHLPNQALIERYVSEFARVLKPGGLMVFQIPSHMSLRWRIQPRRRVYSFLRRVGVGEQFLYHKLGVFPMKMTHFPQHAVEALLSRLHIHLLKIELDLDSSPGMPGAKYYGTKTEQTI